MAVDRVLIDAGPLVAIFSARDQYHRACADAAQRIRGPFFTTWPVVAEAAHLLKSRAGKFESLLTFIETGGLRLLQLAADDIPGITVILSQYADQDLDLADAALMYLADRESISTVFTIDHRHFSLFRTSKAQSLTLVPESLTA